MDRLRIIFAGSGEFGLPVLESLCAGSHEVALVVSQPDRPAGRGRELTPTPIAQAAQTRELPLLCTADINRETLPRADVMIVIAFGQKIGPAAVNGPRLGSINLHASRLPRYRGAAPINWAILNGETVTGNSVIRLAQRMDAGAIIGQSTLPIGEAETAGELHDRLARDGVPLIQKVLEQLATGTAVETPQDESQATIATKISRALASIDFSQTASEIARRICGLSPWPGCRVRICDACGTELGRARLLRARPTADEGPRWQPGEIMTNCALHTGAGGVELIDLQPDGGKPMSLADYRRGHRWHAGLRVESI